MADDLSSSDMRRLWTPWRMTYVGGGAVENGCIFCNRLGADDDVSALIVHRGQRTFIMMNLFPYNTGHLMIVPNAHVATAESSEPETLAEMATLLQPVSRALRCVLNPAGFNVGLNFGEVAGAGVASHLHMHVVPRWVGDANFMPIVASTMVMPELIPVTYAKIRAEMERESPSADLMQPTALIIFAMNAEQVLTRITREGRALPTTTSREGEAVWLSATRTVTETGIDASLIGWAGWGHVGSHVGGLSFATSNPSTPAQDELVWTGVDHAIDALPPAERSLVSDARARSIPPVVAPPG